MGEKYYVYNYSKLNEPSVIQKESWTQDNEYILNKSILKYIMALGCGKPEKIDYRYISGTEVVHIECAEGKSWIFSLEEIKLNELQLIEVIDVVN